MGLTVPAVAQAQVREGDEAQTLYREAIERFEHEQIPIMVGRRGFSTGRCSTVAGTPRRANNCGPPTRC
ncbi:hypothetical protein ACH40F_36795 [Streptomyces sp. NPDC020794]|uniref:hypothetical protein n=1 Tax=unclassified Streptomyces TaxID=2593676 RepID=UPI0036E5075D